MSTTTTNLGMIKAEGSDIVNVVDHISNNFQILDNTFAAYTTTTLALGGAAAMGTSIVVARADHAHGMPSFGTPVDVGTAISAGVSGNVARADHVHKLAAGAINNANLIVDGIITSAKLSAGIINAASLIGDGVVTAPKTDSDVARINHLINPKFQHWNRGTSVVLAANAFGPDRWEFNKGGTSTLTANRNAGATYTPRCQYNAQLVYVHNAESGFRQKLEDFYEFKGRVVTFSAIVVSGVATAVRLSISDGVTTSYSSYHTGSTAAELLSVTHTVSSSATALYVSIQMTVSGTYYIGQTMLSHGSSASDFIGYDAAEDAQKCERYYEVLGDTASGAPGINTPAQGAGQTIGITLWWSSKKGGSPTVTKNGTWSLTNCTGHTVDNQNMTGARMYVTSSAAGAVALDRNSTDDTITVEWNP